LDDAKKCREVTGCKDIMVGRGALALPNFAQVLKQEESIMSWQDVQGLLFKYTQFEVYGDKSRYYPNRIKQWLRYLKIQYPQADELFQTLRTLKTAQEIRTVLERKV
jgi:tRNA-dihydrouridine synthase C